MNRLTRRTLPIRTVRSEATESQAYAGCGNAERTKHFRRDLEWLDAWVAAPEESRVNTIPWGSPSQVWSAAQDEHREHAFGPSARRSPLRTILLENQWLAVRETAMKPLPTNYKDCTFRSRTEARWAVFFTHMDWKWKYEDQGYELESGGYYLPDFEILLPNLGACAVEVLMLGDWRAAAGEVGLWPECGHLARPTLGWKSQSGRPERKRFAFHIIRGRWALRAPEQVRWQASTCLSTWPPSPSA